MTQPSMDQPPMAQPRMAPPGVRPFRIDVPDEALANLRRRVVATIWPEKETVADQSQGVPLATMREVVETN
jgi:Epoxide hydrolase N terminus